jgi:hypothetical protein
MRSRPYPAQDADFDSIAALRHPELNRLCR